MKFNRLLFIVTVVCLPVFGFGKDREQTAFKQGNSYYSTGQYQKALDTYHKILNDGYVSADLYFNMGNASYKNGDIPSALLYYGKAHKLEPGDEDINFNIRFVNLKTTDKVDEAPELFLNRWWQRFLLGNSLKVWAIWSVIAFMLGSSMLVFYFFSSSVIQKKASFYSALLVFTAGLFLVFIAQRQEHYFNGHREAIIFTSSVNVKSGPIASTNNLFVIHEGTKVNVLDTSNGWLKIRLANGNEGWILLTDAREI